MCNNRDFCKFVHPIEAELDEREQVLSQYASLPDDQLTQMINDAYDKVGIPLPEAVLFADGFDDWCELMKIPGNEHLVLHDAKQIVMTKHDALVDALVTENYEGSHNGTMLDHLCNGLEARNGESAGLYGWANDARFSEIERRFPETTDNVRMMAELERSAFALFTGWQYAIVLRAPVEYNPFDDYDNDEDVLPVLVWEDGSAIWKSPVYYSGKGHYIDWLARKDFDPTRIEGEKNAVEAMVERIGWDRAISLYPHTVTTDDRGIENVVLSVGGHDLKIKRSMAAGRYTYDENYNAFTGRDHNSRIGKQVSLKMILRKRRARSERDAARAMAAAQKLLPAPQRLLPSPALQLEGTRPKVS